MDFLDPQKRRAHTIRLFIGYALVGIALLIATIVLGLYTFGFDINRKTGNVIQNGLVFVDAHPVGADITLNGQPKGRTSTRLTIAEGQYKLTLSQAGYRSWSKQFSLEGGQIQRMDYALLFPTKLVSKDAELYGDKPGLVTSSTDRHWLIIQKPGSLTDFENVDLTTNPNNPTALNLPNDLFTKTGANHVVSLVEWASDNRHVLVKHTWDGGSEYALINSEIPASSQNLTKLLKHPNIDFSLRDKKFDRYYLYDSASHTLSSQDQKDPSPTAVLAHVLSFSPYKADAILYVTDDGVAAGKVKVAVKVGADTFALREITPSDHYLLSLAGFNGHLYMVAGDNPEGRVYIFRDPVETTKRTHALPPPVAALRQDNPQFLSFSDNARFIEVQSGSKFSVYDAEDIRVIHYDTQLSVDASVQATWMDGNRLVLPSAGKLEVFDFDGTNKQTLNTIEPGYASAFDKDYKALFTVSPSVEVPGRTALVRTELRVTP